MLALSNLIPCPHRKKEENYSKKISKATCSGSNHFHQEYNAKKITFRTKIILYANFLLEKKKKYILYRAKEKRQSNLNAKLCH